jgi:LacI family transcriptional regulator, kdg operon repressor
MIRPSRSTVSRHATINDVAREAGTGKTSVSRYLNGELDVLSLELQERIAAAITRLNYRPNQMARGLKRGRNRLIGMLFADLTNPYTVEVMQGVEAACHKLGYMPLVCNAANEVEMERRYLQLLMTYHVEGVVINALGVREDALRPVGDGGIPVVLVDRSIDGLVADIVGLDNTEAVRQGVEHLVERGFEFIYFVVQPFKLVRPRRMREAAFNDAMRVHGTVQGHGIVLDLDDAEAVERTLTELALYIDRARGDGIRRIAFFAANAPVALTIARHLNARYGVLWQERVALMSIDDPEWAELAGITTIRQPTRAIGYRAVEFLHERIEGGTQAARESMLLGELIVRRSTTC